MITRLAVHVGQYSTHHHHHIHTVSALRPCCLRDGLTIASTTTTSSTPLIEWEFVVHIVQDIPNSLGVVRRRLNPILLQTSGAAICFPPHQAAFNGCILFSFSAPALAKL
mmetsp:Transcript_33857/g.59431  ORF Transcript_33857/g.59431 Transcript_33857/m.59431 type:complete len:110 (-) Transcript_33857:161-490(-)